MIHFDNVNKWYGAYHALADITETIAQGEVVVVCGPSGSGKSTLIRTINRLEPFRSGAHLDRPARTSTGAARRRRVPSGIGMVFQQFNLFPHLSVLDNCTLARSRCAARRPRRPATRRWRCSNASAWPTRRAPSPPSCRAASNSASRSRARWRCARPSCCSTSPPLARPGDGRRGAAGDGDLVRDGMTLVVVTHEMGFAREVAHRVLFMDQGRVLERAEPHEFFNHPKHPRAQQFLADIRTPFATGA